MPPGHSEGDFECQPILKQLGNMLIADRLRTERGEMSQRFPLHGDMVPRAVKRMFDERSEERLEAGSRTASLSLRGRNHVVTLTNLSRSGAMLRFAGEAHIGESVTLQVLDRGTIAGQVRWLRDGRMGIYFTQPLE